MRDLSSGILWYFGIRLFESNDEMLKDFDYKVSRRLQDDSESCASLGFITYQGENVGRYFRSYDGDFTIYWYDSFAIYAVVTEIVKDYMFRYFEDKKFKSEDEYKDHIEPMLNQYGYRFKSKHEQTE